MRGDLRPIEPEAWDYLPDGRKVPVARSSEPVEASLRFFVPGLPVGKGRARIGRTKSGFAVAYTPAKTRTYEGIVATLALQAMGGRRPWPGPLELRLVATFPIPASWPRWKRDKALLWIMPHTGRPDADNVLKAVCDGLNGVAFGDDAQICCLSVSKGYGDRPGVEVHLLFKPELKR